MPRLAVLMAALLTAAFLVGCGPADHPPGGDEERTAKVPRPSTTEGVFLMAEPRIREDAIPERFSRELPARVADLEAQAADYPLVHIRKRLCAGDTEVLGRFARAVNAAADAGDDLDALRRGYGSLLRWCGRPAARGPVAAISSAARIWTSTTDPGAWPSRRRLPRTKSSRRGCGPWAFFGVVPSPESKTGRAAPAPLWKP